MRFASNPHAKHQVSFRTNSTAPHSHQGHLGIWLLPGCQSGEGSPTPTGLARPTCLRLQGGVQSQGRQFQVDTVVKIQTSFRRAPLGGTLKA